MIILRQINRHYLAALLTANREFTDPLYVHDSAGDGRGTPSRQLVFDPQSNDDGCVPVIRV